MDMRKTFIALGLVGSMVACSKNEAPRADANAPTAQAVATSGEGAAANGADAKKEVAPAADPEPAFREVTIPAGTVLKLNLESAVGSDTSKVEDAVRATLRTPITIGGVQALPAGTVVSG